MMDIEMGYGVTIMTFQTKEEVLEDILKKSKPICPKCKKEMNLWEVPPIPMGDALGWGTPYMYVCFNDECPVYEDGWQNMADNYGHTASYRFVNYPGTDIFECMPVFGASGAKGQIVDEQVLKAQERQKEMIKRGFSALADCYVTKDVPSVLHILFDSSQPQRVRMKAAEMAGDLGDLDAIELLANAKFGHRALQDTVDESIKKIHERHFTRECPFCAEIIKKRAKICKHCHREVAGI
jgi:ribosomal protein L37AE/L43A